ncbi:MAG: hypothetical protein CLLPBCKN_003546 [Chroococcidiopsis cubana SAG 39.79]|nr:hypothetical protein [Chroococcidiopsis cubana SAG 39.79]
MAIGEKGEESFSFTNSEFRIPNSEFVLHIGGQIYGERTPTSRRHDTAAVASGC